MDELQLIAGRLGEIFHRTMGGKASRAQMWPVLADNLSSSSSKTFTWGSKEEADTFRRQIEKAHGIKLS